MIKDSGERREFESGAVRDCAEGKGRCDLLPLYEVSLVLGTESRTLHYDPIIRKLDDFTKAKTEGERIDILVDICEVFIGANDWDVQTAILEVSKHFEEGAKKYSERNWEKGLPTHCYLDSAIRHFIKWERGDSDEPHDRAFLWNILCLMWTIRNRPEFDDLKGE